MAIVYDGGPTRKRKPVQRPQPAAPRPTVKGKTLLQTLIDRRKATEAAIAAFKRRK